MNVPAGFQSGFYSGLSGLQTPIPKYRYPPPYENSSRLTYYSTLFNSIEFNSSFYKLPQISTVTKWSDSVSENFRFTFKMWKEITHSKGLTFKEKDVDLFLKAINPVHAKKGCLLIQFPPGLSQDYRYQLDRLLGCIREFDTLQWKIAIEFRNKTWYNDTIYDLLNSFKAGLVIHDIPKSVTPHIDHTSDFIYIRFHGPTGNYRGEYPEEFLSEYSSYIQEWLDQGKMVFVYFNNTMGEALNNLQTLNQFVFDSKPILK